MPTSPSPGYRVAQCQMASTRLPWPLPAIPFTWLETALGGLILKSGTLSPSRMPRTALQSLGLRMQETTKRCGSGGYCNSCEESDKCTALFGSDNDWYSSSSYAYDEGYAWFVYFNYGFVYDDFESNPSHARCERGGP